MEILRTAVRDAVQPGDRVLDLGCGVGVLGLFALEAGAGHVTFVDETAIIEIARESMARAGFAERCSFVEGSSYDISLPERVDVILSDHLGFFGIDYDVLPMLADAKARFLAPGGRILPEKLTLFAGLLAIEDGKSQPGRWTGKGIPQAFHWVSETNASMKVGEDVPGDARMSDAATVATIDLGEAVPDLLQFRAHVSPNRPDRISGIGGWFAADLGHGHMMTNDPAAPDRIDRSVAVFPLDAPVAVQPGDAVQISILARPEEHVWYWTLETSGEKRSQLNLLQLVDQKAAGIQRSSNPSSELNARGQIRRQVLSLIDGTRSASEIEEMAFDACTGLRPSDGRLRDEIRRILAANTA